MNIHAIRSIFMFEMHRWWRTFLQSIISPVISTSLYVVVFGAAMATRDSGIAGVSYAAFIIPGLLMLSLLTESISNASFGIYFPKFTGTIYEIHSAPIAPLEIIAGYVGAAASKSVILGLIILATAAVITPLHIDHPLAMLGYLVLIAMTFSLFGFLIGIWANSFQQLQFIPLLIITPLTFLGGAFYQVKNLPGIWREISLFNPVVYLISGFRWTFFGGDSADVPFGVSLATVGVCFVAFLSAAAWIFKTGYKIKT